MNKLFTAIVGLVIACSVHSQEALKPANSIAEAKAQAEIKCKQTCLVLSPDEIAAIEMGIHLQMQKAFNEGRKYERSSI